MFLREHAGTWISGRTLTECVTWELIKKMPMEAYDGGLVPHLDDGEVISFLVAKKLVYPAFIPPPPGAPVSVEDDISPVVHYWVAPKVVWNGTRAAVRLGDSLDADD